MVAAQTSKFSASALATMSRSLQTISTPGARQALQAALDAEFAAARAMSDDVFWGYDGAWLALGAPELVNTRRPGASGGGGQNMSWNNNQFWKLAQECDRGLFSLVMYQQRRYMAAQIRIRRHLANVPQPEVVAGFDASDRSDVRRACGGVHPKDRATDWAYWCEEAVRLIGVARWASNFSWSDGIDTCADYGYRLDPYPTVGNSRVTGCRYLPDCATDAFGVPRLGYIAGRAPDGVARWKVFADQTPSARADLVEAARAWTIQWDTARENAELQRQGLGTPFGFGAFWPISISPYVLGLHASSRTQSLASVVPTGPQAFDGAWAGGTMRGTWPLFLQQASGQGLGDRLLALFLELPTNESAEAYAKARTVRERTGCWYWKYESSGVGPQGTATNLAHPAPASELVIWRLVAQLRDIAALSFGQLVIDGFTNLDLAAQRIPAEFRSASFDQAASGVRSAANALRASDAQAVGAGFAAATAAATTVNPLAGLVIGILSGLTTALVQFSLELGLARPTNPPALQAPAMRVAAVTASGDDRCWVNPGELESLEQYQVRVTSPYAEAARRVGGDPGRLFDLIPQVRAEQFCQRNPTAPQCLQPPPPAAEMPWKKWAALAASGAVSYLAVRIGG